MYNYSFFSKSIPEWKKKKDPLIARLVYRPVSFLISSFCANHGVSANAVSYFSAIIAFIACFLISINNFVANIIGAVLVNFWLILDCVDGNLARSVKKMPFGEFADGASSYILVAFLGLSLGINTYYNGGCFLNSLNFYSIIIGALISIFDSLTRLLFQKFKVEEMKINPMLTEVNMSTDTEKNVSVVERIQEVFGIGGWLPIFVLFGVIFQALDLVLIYCLVFYGLFFIFGSIRTFSCVLTKTKMLMDSDN